MSTSTADPFVILIPAYEPDEKLLALIRSIRAHGCDAAVVIVDDGSDARYAPVFGAAAALGCDVIGHQPNRGKGFALKSGFAHIARAYPGRAVVCADCDGQHRVTDILRVAAATDDPRTTVLGARQFVGDVPVRSRFGNGLTRVLFARSTGLTIHDTQTGLRGYPPEQLEWLRSVEGDRFEYELELLLQARRAGYGLVELPIDTIYLAGNESSHFRPVADSLRVYAPLVRFSLSSLGAFAVDFVAVLGLMAATGRLGLSVVLARLLSASLNFLANRSLVFHRGRRDGAAVSAGRYAALALAVLAGNYALLSLLHLRLGMALVPAKVLTEAALFATSYQVQKRVVFAARRRTGSRPEDGPSPELDAALLVEREAATPLR